MTIVAGKIEKEDRAFFEWWYSHMKKDQMQAPLDGVSHSVARYIWDAAVDSEREECARLVERKTGEMRFQGEPECLFAYAAAESIRARGKV